MSKIHPSKWAHPIPVEDFSNFTAVPIAVEPGKRNFFETKDFTSQSGHRLRVKVRMTFSGLKTKNKAIYLPDEHFKSAHTFITPYPKPVQVHHEDTRDPIGRVIDVRYVDTTNEAIMVDSRVSSISSVFKDAKAKPMSKLLTVPTLLTLSSASGYKGMGHIIGLWDITDPDAIMKIQDGRYLTVSTAMSPEGAYCSACAQEGDLVDWAKQHCDHDRGDIVNGYECVAVPYRYEWDEVSPVNQPAAPLSQIIEVGENLSFADARTDYSVPYEIFSDMFFGKEGPGNNAVSIKDGRSVSLPNKLELSPIKTLTSETRQVIGKQDSNQKPILEGNIMKVTDLTKDTGTNYNEIVKFLPEDAVRLTGDFLKDLEDSVFIGPNRTFPVKDMAHAVAIKALLETLEDSDSKASLLESVEDQIKKLTPAPEMEDPRAPETIADSVNTETVIADASPDNEPKMVTLSVEDHKVLLDKVEQLDDVSADRDILKKRVQSLQAEVDSLNASYNSMLGAHKVSLAEALADAQEARGFKIEDRVETVKKFSGRSIESLKDQISDLKSQPVTGAARQASGERVQNPLNTETEQPPPSPSNKDEVEKYAGILSRYYDMFFSDGANGPAKAKIFLNEARRSGLIPANVEP